MPTKNAKGSYSLNEVLKSLEPDGTYMKHGYGIPQTSMLDNYLFWNSGLSGDYCSHAEDSQIGLVHSPNDKTLFERFGFPDTHFDSDNDMTDPNVKHSFLSASNQQPQSRGSVKIKSKDPTVHPLIDLNYYDNPTDMKVMLAAT
eukprot:UN14176